MCRSIKQLREGSEVASSPEIEAAALQFVRKISGYRQPSKRNEAVFNRAVVDVAATAARLLDELTTKQPA